MDVRDALGKVLREHTQAAADLQHDVLRGQLGSAADHAEDVRVDQEVLPEVVVGTHAKLAHPPQTRLDEGAGWLVGLIARRSTTSHGAHAQPNTRAALRSTVAPSSPAETPRSSARKATV